MSCVNETIYEAVAHVENFLNKWIDEKEEAGEDVEKLRQEVDYGMLALQTLLENYADLAFDVFEAWSLRNLFVVDAQLPIVAPHHRGLDLSVPVERERELQIEVETLRRKLENMQREYAKIRRMEAQTMQNRRKAEALLQSISYVDTTAAESEQAAKPLAQFLQTLRELRSIPETSDPKGAKPTTSHTAYLKWAIGKLMNETEMDKVAARNAEEQAKAIFDSDDSAVTGSSLGRLPPEIDEDDDTSMSSSSTD